MTYYQVSNWMGEIAMTQLWQDDAAPVLVRGDEAELLGAAPDTMRLLIDGDTTGGSLSAIRTTMRKGMQGAAPHFHRNSAELFFIISGALHVLTGDRVATVHEGDLLMVPPNTDHAFATPADSGVDMLFLMPRTQRFDYFRLINQVRGGTADPQEILDSQERFDNHFLDSQVWREFRDAGA
jgi:mannose-6-phosphate isomerase-like protein (cupin superfamily)